MNQALVTQYLHSRGGVALMWVIAIAASYVALSLGAVEPFTGNGGVALPSANNWLEGGGTVSWSVSIALNAVIAVFAIGINRTFNVLRSMTMLFGGLYAVMMAATPALLGQLYGGTVMALVLLMCQFILYTMYAYPGYPRRVFLMFFLLSLTALTVRAAMFYMPVLLIGCLQMRIFNWRTLLAALIGLITPGWILLGLGLVTVDQFVWPELGNVFPLFDKGEMLPIYFATGFTMLLGVLATLANLVKMLSYNARTRALNGFISVSLIATVLLVLFDWSDALIYVPMLNILTAIQVSHFLSHYAKTRHGYLPVVGIILAYIVIYQWSI